MQTRTIGTNGPQVSALGLGTMGMTGGFGLAGMYGPADEAEAIATIHRALGVGVNFIDTAEVYGPYVNEELVGRALEGRRDEVILATKFGFNISDEGKIKGMDGRPENARRAIDASLKRLATDHIDLWYLHRLDPAVPIEETVGAMADLVQEGKVRWLGLSEVSATTLRRACSEHSISALQSEYSLWERTLEREIAPTCRELGVTIVPYCPLGRGFLSGKISHAEDLADSDYRRFDPRYHKDNHAGNQHILATLGAVAERHAASNAQIALAWLLHRNDHCVPIPGTKRRTYLEENAAAADIVLDATDLAELDACDTVSGNRYTDAGMAMIDQ
jgi:aryl-alcohol dehydrogenase-like predicted oxidoreductase